MWLGEPRDRMFRYTECSYKAPKLRTTYNKEPTLVSIALVVTFVGTEFRKGEGR